MKTSRVIRVNYDHQIFSLQRYGGISRYVVELASRVGALPEASVRIIAPIYINRLLASAHLASTIGLHLERKIPRTTKPLYLLNAGLSQALMRVFPADIIHETYFSKFRTAPASAKVILTVYDMIYEKFPADFTPAEVKYVVATKTEALRRADHIVCISNHTRGDLLHFYPVDPERVSVIHLASSLAPRPSPSPAVAEPYILYVGARWGYKNFFPLLKAFAISNLRRSVKLICLGGGPLTREELGALAEYGIPAPRVEVVYGDDALLAAAYRGAELFVYPSQYEGFGIPLLEAMQCDCPVVCSNTSSLPEVAGEAAEYFDPADVESIASALLRVVGNSERRTRMITAGRQRTTMFSWDRCARETLDRYRAMLGR